MRNISFVQPKGQGGSVPIIVLKDATGRYYYEDLSTTVPVDIVLDEATGLIRVSAIGGGIFMRAQANASGGEAVPATATLTLTGAITGGVHAESVVTADTIADGNEVTIGDITYVAKATLSTGPTVPYEVLIGAGDAEFLDNLKSAINGTAGVGTTYSTGTEAHPDVVATDNTDTTQTVVARVPGVSENDIATTGTATRFVWADTTLGGGTGSSVAGVNGETVDINGTEYTFQTVLSEDYADAIPNQVLHAGTDATALDNLKLAVNGGATEGTEYSTGTTQPDDIEATTNTDTTQVFQAQTLGEAGNVYTVSDTLANGSFGGESTFTGGSETANFDAYIPAGETMDFGIDDDVTTISFVAVGSTTDVAVVEY